MAHGGFAQHAYSHNSNKRTLPHKKTSSQYNVVRWGKRESNTDRRNKALEAYLVHSLFPVSLYIVNEGERTDESITTFRHGS